MIPSVGLFKFDLGAGFLAFDFLLSSYITTSAFSIVAFGAGITTFFWSFACFAGYFGEVGLTVSFMMTSFL